jgi:hypothetical protein
MATATNNPPRTIDNKYVFDATAKPSQVEQLFQGFLAKDELAIWIGHEKHRKTTLVLDFAIAAALGRDFLGFQFAAPAPLQVVMFDFESKDNSIHRRRDKICEAMELTAAQLAMLDGNLKIIKLREMIHDGLEVPKIDHPRGRGWWESAVAEHPADLYIIDPFRCLHAGAENDSAIETTLRLIRTVFRRSTIIPHHTVKSSQNPKENVRLSDNMRLWSEICRGSGAIKGHADLIVCQERVFEDDKEIVYLGGFMKDAGDIDPMPLVESAHESFLWVPHTKLPQALAASAEILRRTGSADGPDGSDGSWLNRSAVAAALVAGGIPRATAYRHVKQLMQRAALCDIGAGRIAFAATSRTAAPMADTSDQRTGYYYTDDPVDPEDIRAAERAADEAHTKWAQLQVMSAPVQKSP